MIKRFQIGGITRDKEYDLTAGNKGSKITYLEVRPNGESEIVTIQLTPSSAAKTKVFDTDFNDIIIKGRASQGNILTVYPVKSIKFKALGNSSLGGIDIFYDEIIGKLNSDKRGKYLGNFNSDDKILVVYINGEYELTNFELTNRYQQELINYMGKFKADQVFSVVHYVGEDKTYYVKRFKIDITVLDKKYPLISDSRGSKLVIFTAYNQPEVEIIFTSSDNKKGHSTNVILNDYIDVKSWKATGNKLASTDVSSINLLPEKDTSGASTQVDLFGKGK
jgi:topoisomerase-4 subunit A